MVEERYMEPSKGPTEANKKRIYQYQHDFEIKVDKMNNELQKELVVRADIPKEAKSPAKSMRKGEHRHQKPELAFKDDPEEKNL